VVEEDQVQLIITKQVEQRDLVVEVEEKQIHLLHRQLQEQLIQVVVEVVLLIIVVDQQLVQQVVQE
jgi:hypothetical protein